MKKPTRRERAAAKRGQQDERQNPSPSGNGPLIRNLLIIALLIVTIAIVWKERERTLAARAVEARQRLASPPPPPTQKFTPAPRPPAAPPAPGTTTETAPTPAASPPPAAPTQPAAPDGPSPAQSLIRLRAELAAGKRDAMPVGTLTRGDSDYFLVTTPMTWQQAHGFADAYGGHLPLIADRDSLDWLAGHLAGSDPGDPARTSLWIGARRLAGKWQQVDGSPLATAPVGEGDFAALDDHASLHARDEGDLHPFLIQWQRDGSNPASLRAVLARTKAALESARPDPYPPGTLALGERHLLVVARAVDAAEARELATLAGGHLMIPATPGEADWLATGIDATAHPEGLWLGGRQNGGEWKWDSGEAWTFARWDPAKPPGDDEPALLHLPGAGWRAVDPAARASGFIIEWSRDSAAPSSPSTTEGADDLFATARARLLPLEKQRDAALVANARTFTWNLDTWLRTNNKSEINRWRPRIAALKATVRAHRVPEQLPRAPDDHFSPRMLTVARDAAAKQKSIDADFLAKAARIRDAHVARLRELAAEEERRGQPALARRRSAAADAAADLGSWLETITATPGG
jgi:hypothetical protein